MCVCVCVCVYVCVCVCACVREEISANAHPMLGLRILRLRGVHCVFVQMWLCTCVFVGALVCSSSTSSISL